MGILQPREGEQPKPEEMQDAVEEAWRQAARYGHTGIPKASDAACAEREQEKPVEPSP